MKKLFIISVPMIFLFASCKKDEPAPIVPANPTYTIGGQMASFFPATQSFQLDAATGGTITGSKGGTFTFAPNSFLTLSNQAVSGNITIKLIEVYSPLDMVLTKVFPMSYGGPLYSGGEFNIVATQNNQQLKLAQNVTYNATIPTNNPVAGMQVFDGVTVNDSTTWVQTDTGTTYVYLSQGPNQYNMTCDSIHWANCDQFPTYGTWTNITLHATAPVTIVSYNTYIYYDGHNAIFGCPGDPFSSSGAATTECWDAQQVHLIVMGVDASGNIYSGFLPITVSVNGVYNIAMTATTSIALAAQMNALN